jgi:hypothetical protein
MAVPAVRFYYSGFNKTVAAEFSAWRWSRDLPVAAPFSCGYNFI